MGLGLANIMTGGLLDLASGYLNQQYATSQRHGAQDFEKEMYQQRYQMQVADMKKAGLNPMLAATQGAPGAPSSSAPAVKGYDLAGAVSSSRVASAQEANLNALTLKTGQDAKTSAATEKNLDADTLGKAGIPAVQAAQIVNLTSSAQNMDMASKKIEAEIPQVKQQIKNLQQQLQKDKSNTELNNKLTESQNYLNQLTVAQTYLAGKQANVSELDAKIKDPKAKAAQMPTGKAGAIAENVWKIFSPFK